MTTQAMRGVAFRCYAAGWADRKIADMTEVHIPAVDTPHGAPPMTLHEAHAEWDRRQDFTQHNRRQTAKLGFMAGWHSRKLAEVKSALGIAKKFNNAGFISAEEYVREERQILAEGCGLDGRNWFRDSRGRVWVDVPSAAIEDESVFELLDAGIPTG